MKQKKSILLFGPTASGKSRLALDIAKKLNGEIINADSMQIYKEIKILSARPSEKNIKHHLYGFISVKKDFSVGHWHKLAADKIKEVRGKGLLTAFEMHDSPHLDGHRISVELLKNGVYVKETHHNIVRIAPALTIEAWQIDNLAEAIRTVIKNL